MLGNPKAVNRNTRFIDTDLNRSFGKEAGGYESRRAKQIAKLLKNYDLLLDIHTTTTDMKLVPIVASLGPKTKKVINVMPEKEVILMEPSMAMGSLIGYFGDGAVSLELGEEFAQKHGLALILRLIKRLADDKLLPSKPRFIYRVSRTIPTDRKFEARNFEDSEELGGYAVLPKEASYKGFAGFVADSRDKLLI